MIYLIREEFALKGGKYNIINTIQITPISFKACRLENVEFYYNNLGILLLYFNDEFSGNTFFFF
jgi:hypothetical protein